MASRRLLRGEDALIDPPLNCSHTDAERGSDLIFFVSSRRRHTRYWRDWSSDVCSSDLAKSPAPARWRAMAPTRPSKRRRTTVAASPAALPRVRSTASNRRPVHPAVDALDVRPEWGGALQATADQSAQARERRRPAPFSATRSRLVGHGVQTGLEL